MKSFSVSWKSSSNPKKQRKYRHNAPLHVKQHFMAVHLSKELRAKHKTRAVQVRKGDVVTVMRGKFKKHSGKVERVDLKKGKVFLSGLELTKKDGTKSFVSVEPSNLLLTEIGAEDKKRKIKQK